MYQLVASALEAERVANRELGLEICGATSSIINGVKIPIVSRALLLRELENPKKLKAK